MTRSQSPDQEAQRIQRALSASARAEPLAAAELLPLVFDELRRLARARLAHLAPGQTLQATALVHEAWMRVVGDEDPGWECRAHFFAAAAQAMRNILVESLRRKHSLRHGAGRVPLEGSELPAIELGAPAPDLLALDEALERLRARDEVKARIVMLRFFTGLSMPEIADVLGLPLTRVEREWRFSRAWLQREVDGTRPAG
jgi:RNA polymerase sigma factor (TIGR02999 family)